MREIRAHDSRVVCDRISHFSIKLGESLCHGKAIVDLLHVESACVTRIFHLLLLQGQAPSKLFTGGLFGEEGEEIHSGPFLYLRGTFPKEGETPYVLRDFVLVHVKEQVGDLQLQDILSDALRVAGIRGS